MPFYFGENMTIQQAYDDAKILGTLCKLQRARIYLINQLCDDQLSNRQYDAIEQAIVELRNSIMVILGEIS